MHAVTHLDDPLAALSRAFPPSVTVTRTSEEDCQTRQLVVSIDGRTIATLGAVYRLTARPR